MNLLYFEFEYASLYSVDTWDEVSRWCFGENETDLTYTASAFIFNWNNSRIEDSLNSIQEPALKSTISLHFKMDQVRDTRESSYRRADHMSRCQCLLLSSGRRLRQHGTWCSTINRHLAVGGERNTQREVHLSRIPNQQPNGAHSFDDPSSSLMPFSCRYGWWVCKRSSQGQSAIVTGAAGYKFDFQPPPLSDRIYLDLMSLTLVLYYF